MREWNEIDASALPYPMLLHTDIRQVHVHIVQFGDARIVLNGAKTTKAQFEEVCLQWTKRCDQHVQTQIEFLATD